MNNDRHKSDWILGDLTIGQVAIAVDVKVCSCPSIQRTKLAFVLFLLRTARELRDISNKLRLTRDK